MRNLLTNSHFQHLGGNTNFEHQLKLLHQQQAAMAAAEIHLRLAVQRQAQTFLDAGGFCNNGARFASPVSPEPSPLQPTASEPPKGIASLEIPARHSASQQQHMTSPASEYVGCLKDPMHGVFRPPVGFMPGPGNHDQDTSNRFGLGLGPSAIWLRSSEPGQSDLGVGLSDSFSPAPRHGSEYRPMSQRRSSWGVDLPSEEAMFSDQRTTLGSRTRTSPGFNNCQQFPFGGSRPQQGDLFFDSSEDLMTQSFTSLAVGCHDGNQYMPGTSQAGLQSLQISTRLPSGQDGVVPGRLAGPTMAGLSEWSVPGSEAARW